MTDATVPSAVPAPMTVPEALARHVRERGDAPLLSCDEDVLTFADADARSRALACQLLAHGAGKATRIGLLYPNGPDFVVAWLAAARIGAITVPFSTFSTAPELRTMLRGAHIEWLLGRATYRGRDYRDAMADILGGISLDASPIYSAELPALRHVQLADGDADLPAPAIDAEGAAGSAGAADEALEALLAAVEATVRPADRMVIVHTSGSTSAPKGVVHTTGSLLQHMANLNTLRRLTPDEVLFSNSPFFWIGGFAFSLVSAFLAGATLVCSNATEASDVLDLLERTRPTLGNGFAQPVAFLARDPSFPSRDLSSLRRGNLWPILPDGVRPADPELRHNMLGMTEAGSVCLLSDDESDQPEGRRGSFGRPAPGFEARIVDWDTGADLPAGSMGELLFRGPYLMDGYDGRERHETFDPDGWFHTGDVFSVDDEGFYYFSGRRGDMIKTAGANVSPREVEAAILDGTGLASHVIGLADPERGQLVAAALRIPAGAATPEVDELRQALRARLSAYKVPRRFLMLPDGDVPMLSTGKIDSGRLRRLFDDSSHSGVVR